VGKRSLARLIGALVLFAIAGSAGSALASPSKQSGKGSGSIGVRLVDPPSSRGPLARLYVVDLLAPGTSIRRRIEISNTTDTTAAVAVYPAAAGLRRGTFGFAAGHARNDLSSWTSVSRRVLRLAPGTKAFETITIDVPKDATRGEHYAVIWAETSTPAPARGGLTLVNRVGVRMYVSVGPGGALLGAFTISSLGAKRSAAGLPYVTARVLNSGRRTLDLSGSLRLSRGPGGLRAGPFPVKLTAAVAPGKSEPLKVRLARSLPRGPWHAELRLRSGALQRVATGTLTFPRVSAEPVTKDGSTNRLLLIGLVALASLGALAGLFHRGFRRPGVGVGPAAQ
jgi:hypothetical protein